MNLKREAILSQHNNNMKSDRPAGEPRGPTATRGPVDELAFWSPYYGRRGGKSREAYPVNSGELHNGPDKDWAAADGQETPWLRMDRRPCNCASLATASPLGRADGRLGVT